MRHLVVRLLLALVVLVPLSWDAPPAAAMEVSRVITQLYADASAYPPRSGAMTVCYGFVCRRRMELVFSGADRAAVTAMLAAGKGSAAAERAAVQKAVIWFDRRIGPVIGTDKRIARADFRYGVDNQNFDCTDTTRNTTGFLLIMQDWGLFKYHSVGDPRYRGNALVLQTPHNTAILIERATGVQWVVDMWTRAYGQAPEVMPVDQWMTLD
jgi:hypothetical protein